MKKSLKKLTDEELAELVGGRGNKTSARVRGSGGNTWLYDCWEGTCTPGAVQAAKRCQKANVPEKACMKKINRMMNKTDN